MTITIQILVLFISMGSYPLRKDLQIVDMDNFATLSLDNVSWLLFWLFDKTFLNGFILSLHYFTYEFLFIVTLLKILKGFILTAQEGLLLFKDAD